MKSIGESVERLNKKHMQYTELMNFKIIILFGQLHVVDFRGTLLVSHLEILKEEFLNRFEMEARRILN
jgi:hypothetical protein